MKDEKYLLEKSAIEIFVKRYNNFFENKIQLIKMQDKPDALLKDSNDNLFGIEITHLYLDATEAKYALNKSNEKHDCINLLGYIEQLNQLLTQKESKILNYKVSYPVDLLIRSASPLFSKETIELYRNNIKIPKQSIRNIWLLLDNDKYTERWVDLVKLFDEEILNL